RKFVLCRCHGTSSTLGQQFIRDLENASKNRRWLTGALVTAGAITGRADNRISRPRGEGQTKAMALRASLSRFQRRALSLNGGLLGGEPFKLVALRSRKAA